METRLFLADITALNNEALYAALYNKCPKFRRDKADTLVSKSDKRRCIGAYILLLHALYICEIKGRAPVFALKERGKPYMANCPHVHFNISHSGKYALCALSDNEIGCDIERMDRHINRALLRRCLSDGELEALNNIESSGIYAKIWTLKESALKCAGQGFGLNPQSFSVLDKKGLKTNTVFSGKTYSLRQFDYDGYSIACCEECADAGNITITNVDIREAGLTDI